ncbi:cytochrome P450 [bacterium]|nr:cytochrome P450 [bacterium]
MDTFRFDPLAADVLPDPYPHYRRLQDEDPVHWGVAGDPALPGCWYVTRYADVEAMLKDGRFGREINAPAAAATAIDRISAQWMVLRDPPTHTCLRGLVQRSFTPRTIEQWMPRMAAIAHRLIDTVADVIAVGGELDLLADFAVPYPVIIVAEMLGVPREDTAHFTPWTRALAAVIEFEQSDAVRTAGLRAIADLSAYLAEIIAQRRVEPQNDLISDLLAIEKETGEALGDDVLIGTCTQLLFGGNDPIAHLIGNGILALSRHPEQLAWLRRQDGVAESAADELMRYDSSVQMTFRYALEDVNWANKTIRRGDLVALVMGAANRDPMQFPHADRLDLARTPNRHLSLGQGIHYCLGAALARTEARVAFDILLRRLPKLSLSDVPLAWEEKVAVRGLKLLPVRF